MPSESREPFCAEPFILPARISHTRLYPRFHRFWYSYLLVGVPITSKGFRCPLITLDAKPSWWDRGWLRIEARDHLEHSLDNSSLHKKLQKFLFCRGLDPNDFPYCYLVTPPRFLNYYNSPASFWFLYSSEKELRAMIAEVDNTFGERRCYLLYERAESDVKSSYSQPVQRCEKDSAVQFSWAKDFHVSPFNSRKGGYSLRANDPMAVTRLERGAVDVTATLKTTQGCPRMVARLHSVSRPIGTKDMTRSDQVTLILSWWWVGLMTFPRVMYQANKLSFLRKLSVFYHPEPTKHSVSRQSTEDEIKLEAAFRRCLKSIVERTSKPVKLLYVAPAPTPRNLQREEIFCSEHSSIDQADTSIQPNSEYRVLTPAFYSRMVHYITMTDLLEGEATMTHEKNRTASIEGEPIIRQLFAEMDNKYKRQPARSLGCLGRILAWSRCGPSRATYPAPNPAPFPAWSTLLSITSAKPSRSRQHKDNEPQSSVLDTFVDKHLSACDRDEYRRVVAWELLFKNAGFDKPFWVALYMGVITGLSGGVFSGFKGAFYGAICFCFVFVYRTFLS